MRRSAPAGDAMGMTHRRWWRWAAAALVLVAALWWLVSARAVSGDYASMRADLPMGDGLLIGHAGLIEQDLSVLGLWPVASPGLDVDFLVCERVDGADSIGAVPEADAPRYCAHLEHVGAGTKLRADPPRGLAPDYLIVRLGPTAEGPQWLCGFDIAYRSGWRFGWQRDVGMRVVVNAAGDDALDDLCG